MKTNISVILVNFNLQKYKPYQFGNIAVIIKVKLTSFLFLSSILGEITSVPIVYADFIFVICSAGS